MKNIRPQLLTVFFGLLSSLRLFGQECLLNFENETYTINTNILGFNTAKLFNKFPHNTTDPQPYFWDWASDESPEILRFPGGTSSRFTHLLAPGAVGLGYNLTEIHQFYDVLDDGVINNSIDGVGSDLHGKYESWVNDYNDDQLATSRFIDDFIYFVKYIEDRHPGKKIKVIVCMNVLTESATANADIVKYLLNQTTNIANYPLNVVGVELGNEMYSDDIQNFFPTFTHYYNYMKGISCFLPSAVPSGVIGDHNYCKKIKQITPVGSIKIGISAAPFKDFPCFGEDEYLGEDIRFDHWDDSIYIKYSDIVVLSHTTKPAFDAVIIHPYYSPECWESCLDDLNITSGTPFAFGTLLPPDSRLVDEFNCASLDFTNFTFPEFQTFITNLSDTYFHFNDVSNNKKLWLTEWNLKDHKSQTDATSNPQKQIYNNTFLHATLNWNWLQTMYKLNLFYGFNPDFIEYATQHNICGESEGNIISINKAPYDNNNPYGQNYSKRALYWTFNILQEIRNKNLKYLNSNLIAGSVYTRFDSYTTSNKNFIYIFYYNYSENDVTLILNYENIASLYPGEIVSIGNASRKYFDALEAYSTSGYNYFYEMNSYYDLPSNAPSFEMSSLTTVSGLAPSSYDLESYSMGYLKIPITHIPGKLGILNEIQNISVKVFPTISDGEFSVEGLNCKIEGIEVYNLLGQKIYSRVVQTYITHDLNIHEFPNGSYIVKVITNLGITYKRIEKS